VGSGAVITHLGDEHCGVDGVEAGEVEEDSGARVGLKEVVDPLIAALTWALRRRSWSTKRLPVNCFPEMVPGLADSTCAATGPGR
jgi:hypothetical protein